MSVTVHPLAAEEVATSPEFAQVAREVYRDDPGWAPASEGVVADRARDAAAGRIALRGVVALERGRPVARAVAIVEPRAVGASGAGEGWVGLVECVPGALDAGVAVLGECAGWLREQGLAVVAPRTDALRAGLVTSGFGEPQMVLTPYNPPWYVRLFAEAGFEPAVRMVGYRFDRARAPRIVVPAGVGVRVRPVDPGNWDGEVARFHAFQEAVFAERPARVPRQAPATALLVGGLREIVDPDLCLVAESSAGRTVGVLVCLPDVWQPRPDGVPPDRARLVSIGLRPGWRGRGAALAMGAALEERLMAKGYRSLEASWVQSGNTAPQRLAQALGAVPSRTSAICTWAPAPRRSW